MKRFFAAALFLAMATSATAEQMPFQFGIDKGTGRIGPFNVKNCKIIIPDLGISTAAVAKQLRKKGYEPVIGRIDGESMYHSAVDSVFVIASGGHVMDVNHLIDPRFAGIPFLESDIVVGPAATQTKLQLKVMGETGLEPLFESKGYDFHLIPGHTDAFEATDLPRCVRTK